MRVVRPVAVAAGSTAGAAHAAASTKTSAAVTLAAPARTPAARIVLRWLGGSTLVIVSQPVVSRV
jgi:hypothetical protein